MHYRAVKFRLCCDLGLNIPDPAVHLEAWHEHTETPIWFRFTSAGRESYEGGDELGQYLLRPHVVV